MTRPYSPRRSAGTAAALLWSLLLLLFGGALDVGPAAAAPKSPTPPAAPAVLLAADSTSLDAVRQALANDPVYVAPDAEAAKLVDADALRRQIGSSPIAIAVLPAAARNATNGNVDELPQAIGGNRAVIVLCGRSLRAS